MAFTAVVVFLLVFDAIDDNSYHVDGVTMTVILAAILTLLGLEAIDFVRK